MTSPTLASLASKGRACRALASTGTPEISVVIPVFNHSAYLPQCLESVFQQEGGSMEMICIDDASTDPLVPEIIAAVADLPGVRCVRNDLNLGISDSQNRAVDMARGRYIAFLDCDDHLRPGALQRTLDVARQHGEPDYIFTDRRNIDSRDKTLFDAIYQLVQSRNGIKRDLTDRMIASHLKVVRKDSFIRAGGFTPRYTGIQDWELALKVARFGEFAYLPEVLYCHRLHAASVTSSDTRGQARKSNLLRREHLESLRLGRPGDGPWAKFSIKELAGKSWYCPEVVYSAWMNGHPCALDAHGALNAVEIEFITDFNSYFDRIHLDNIEVASQIGGSLWTPTLLRSPLHHSAT